MPDRPETYAWLAAWLEANFPAVYAGALALLIAAWRIIYSGGKLRQLLLEAPLCGLLGIGVSYGPALIGARKRRACFSPAWSACSASKPAAPLRRKSSPRRLKSYERTPHHRRARSRRA